MTHEVEQFPTVTARFSIHESLPSSFPIKRTQGDNPLTLVGKGSSRWVGLLEGAEQDPLNYFFQLPTIMLSRIPSTQEEFTAIVANEDLAFVRGLSVTNRQSLFADASHTLFRDRSMVSMLYVVQNNVLGSDDLLKERDDLREKCVALEQDNTEAEKELVVLRVKFDSVKSL